MAKKKKNFSSFVNNPVDFTLLITILLLLAIGLTMVLSASSPSALSETIFCSNRISVYAVHF